MNPIVYCNYSAFLWKFEDVVRKVIVPLCRSTIHIGQRGRKEGEKEEKGFKSVRMLLLHQLLRKELFLHEQYNPGHEISAILGGLCPEVRSQQGIQEIQQSTLLHLLLAQPV